MSLSTLRISKPQQVRAAREIESIFAAGAIHSCFLNADVQSGKTGCFQHLIRRMLQSGMIDRAYILCGSTETELYDQAKADTLAYNSDISDKITVIFRQDFPKHVLNVRRALIVVDESHMDQNVRQKLAQFLSRFGLGMDGTRPEMITNKTYILSVDATGYSEIAALKGGKSRPKHMVTLEPGVGYWGPAQYFEATEYQGQTLLQSTFDLTTGAGKTRFQSLFRPHSWNLMRLPGGRLDRKSAQIQHIQTACDEIGVDVLFFNAKREEVEIACKECEAAYERGAGAVPVAHVHTVPTLSCRPERPTLVLLDGRLRAGKVVPKRHIGFVWEGAKVSNTDAVIQGLLGRMCGYAFGAQKPTVFLPPGLLEKKKEKEVTWCELQRHIFAHGGASIAIPTKATNIVAGRNPKRLPEGKHRCPPIRFHLGEDAEYAEEGNRAHLKELALSHFRDHWLHLLQAHPNFSADQKTELLSALDMMSSEETHIRMITDTSADSQKEWAVSLRSSAQAKTIDASQDVTDFPLVTFAVIATPFLAGLSVGDVFAVFYTNASGLLTAKPAETMFGDVKKVCAFLERTLPVSADAAASATVSFSRQQLATADAFRVALESFIRRRLEDEREHGFVITPVIKFHREHRTFQKSEYPWVSTRQNRLYNIANQVGESLNLHLDVKFVARNSTRASPTFQVDSITWRSRV